jgi:O-6-methylguanine DNA methyltransferase
MLTVRLTPQGLDTARVVGAGESGRRGCSCSFSFVDAEMGASFRLSRGRPMIRLLLERYTSPIGEILIAADGEGLLRALDFADSEARMHRLLRLHYHRYAIDDRLAPSTIAATLAAYFDGDLSRIADLNVRTGGTAFQRTIWAALRSIPAGTTISYGGLARTLARPKASRAVGLANGANPVAIVVPCHRVIGADGSLTGYGGGLMRKRWLLQHESRHA